ncbi:hypothetical protein NEMBOFW57_009482 [Staphylotrichum longicolle]|uniref:Uncharacterized protein n=1 Tax=Staphylotrichum longicolle TaxID=669026 RepID=A0AAD4HUT7_9PEZI|nr:hypothetical protein NEMBOFW57_009482 [Staphylotrichum longicolle]
MAASPSPHATISVVSGCVCFGALHNIWNGASVPVQGFPTVRPRASGTVKAQPIEFNVAARNGVWNAFQLIDLDTQGVVAWFLAHSDVDPEREVDKILWISGSPYESGSGSTFNDDKTAANGVFVINRYDWDYYDKRSEDEIAVVAEPIVDSRSLFSAAGLVDLAAARSMALRWKDQRSAERQWSEDGVWLHIPRGEYAFGRFGFDDDRTAARSFLLFTVNTYFPRTAFKGSERILKKEETPDETFVRMLQEGFDFSGIELLREWSTVPENPNIQPLTPPPPPQADWLGPYDRSDHVLRPKEINAIRVFRNADELRLVTPSGYDMTPHRLSAPILEFIDPWAEPLYDLVNEMVLSYLQRTVVPRIRGRSVSAAAELLFPEHTPEGGRWPGLDVWCHRYFTQPDVVPVPGFDGAYVGSRIASFLSRFGDASAMFDDACVAGITRVVAYMLTMVLERANGRARDSYRPNIMPSDVRGGVYLECQFRDCLQFSRVFWEGRIGSSSAE